MKRVAFRRHLVAWAWETWIALATIIGAALYFLAPATLDASALVKVLGVSLALVWTMGFLIAGLLMAAGVLGRRRLVLIVAYWVLATTTLVRVVAFIEAFGIVSAPSVVTYVGLVVACIARARMLSHGESLFIGRLQR